MDTKKRIDKAKIKKNNYTKEYQLDEEQIKELSDIIIVCGGLYRWFPETAMSVMYFYLDHPAADLIESEVKRKWEINLKRKWAWNGKTYHHVHD